ncbi:MAG: hypothetical protein LBF59_04125 [Prevotellaceae bacterium]|jgi:hypothetical protein|nr:hypothetical protein [Prevotellaceae bacterium]
MTEFEEKKEEKKEEDDDAKRDSRNAKIHGWLTFFLISLGLGATLTVILGFVNFSLSNYDLGLGDWLITTGAACDAILLLGIGFLGMYTTIAFIRYKPNAVALAKAY